jgi:hypothetical protein
MPSCDGSRNVKLFPKQAGCCNFDASKLKVKEVLLLLAAQDGTLVGSIVKWCATPFPTADLASAEGSVEEGTAETGVMLSSFEFGFLRYPFS